MRQTVTFHNLELPLEPDQLRAWADALARALLDHPPHTPGDHIMLDTDTRAAGPCSATFPVNDPVHTSRGRKF